MTQTNESSRVQELEAEVAELRARAELAEARHDECYKALRFYAPLDMSPGDVARYEDALDRSDEAIRRGSVAVRVTATRAVGRHHPHR